MSGEERGEKGGEEFPFLAKVTKTGRGLAVYIPKKVIEYLGIKAGTKLLVKVKVIKSGSSVEKEE